MQKNFKKFPVDKLLAYEILSIDKIDITYGYLCAFFLIVFDCIISKRASS
jgi:hypothetical protein